MGQDEINEGENLKKDCSCMDGSEYDKYPKIFKVSFVVYGTDSKGIRHLVFGTDRDYFIGIDVDDIVKKIKNDHINVEFNYNDYGNMYHVVGQDVVINSVRYMGVLSDMTTAAKKAFGVEVEEDENIE